MLSYFKKIMILVIIMFLLIYTGNAVKALTVVLDPGHGGIDPGAINGQIYESNVTLKIAKYLKEYLNQYEGVSVNLTHGGITNGELTVFDRAIIARDKNADLFISLHVNSSTSSDVNGAEVYVTANTSLDKYNKETSNLGNKILENLKKLGIEKRGVFTKLLTRDTTDRYSDGTMADYYGIIRYAMRGTKIDDGVIWPEGKQPANIQNGEGVPTILIEHCFISSSKDIAYIDSEEDIKKLAKADADAIVAQYGLKLKGQTNNIEKNDEKMIIKTLPSVTKEELVKYLNIDNYTMLDISGNTLNKADEKVATGYKIKIQNKNYTIIKMGDVNGDGKVMAIDALSILKHSTGKKKIDGVYLDASEVVKDGKTNALDALTVLKSSTGRAEISL